MRVSGERVFQARRLLIGASVASLGLLALPALADDAASSASSNPVCSRPELVQTPKDDVERWLVRSMLASQCYEYQARAVSIDSLGVRTLALSHRINDGVRQQVVQHLDGPSISVERRSQAGRLAWFVPDSSMNEHASPEAWALHVEQFYAVTIENEERIAGRVASRLRFDPFDETRYMHTWWVDEETGLLLKHELRDAQERVIETFQMTQLQSPELYDGPLVDEEGGEEVDAALDVNWLPDGFVAQPAMITGDDPLPQRFYSDGLASVSVFATPVADQTLASGVYTLGVSSVAIELVEFDDEPWQLVGIGELPPAQVRRIVQSIELGAPAS